MLATRSASSTVDARQSASKAIYHSYLSESFAGRSPSELSEGGWARVGTKKTPGRVARALSIVIWLDDYSRTMRVTRRFSARPSLLELSAIGLYSPYDVEFIRNRGRPASMLR